MSKIILLIMLFTFSTVFSQQIKYSNFDEIEVGKNPIYSFHWGTTTHVFCAGFDSNQDGELQISDGDQAPSWWTIGRSNNRFIANQMKTFEFQSISENFKPAIDSENRVIYIPLKGKVSSYELLTTNLIEENVYNGNVEVARLAGEHLLFIEQGEINAETGDYDSCELIVFNPTLSMELQSIPAGANAADLLYTMNDASEIFVYVLNDPKAEEFESTIQYALLPHMQAPTFESISIEGQAKMIENNGKVFVINDSNDEVLELNTDGSSNIYNTSLIDYYNTAINTLNDNIAITTDYGSDIRIMDEGGNIDNIISLDEFNSSNINPIRFFSKYADRFLTILVESDEDNIVYIGEEQVRDNYLRYLNVGDQPAKIVYSESNNTYHIFCLGTDLNFNGQLDDGDQLPSWWTLKANGNQINTLKVKDFEMGDLKFPLKLAYDEEIDLIYIPHTDKVSSYDALTFELVEENVYQTNATSVDLAGPHIMFSVRNQDSDDELLVFDRDNSNVLQTITAGENILEAVYFTHSNGLGLAILNEGNFGVEDATLMYGNLPHMQAPNLTTLNIGTTGNDLTYNNGYLGTVSNGSHNINVIHFESDTQYEINTGTAGFNGPRNMVLVGDEDWFSAVVSTYDNDLRFLSPEGLQQILKTSGKVEDIYANFEKESLVATIIFNDDYSSNNKVAIFGDITSSVETDIVSEEHIQIYPNPSSDYIYVRNESPISNIQIFDINGQIVYSNSENGNVLKIDLTNFTTGTYIIKVSDSKSIKTSKFNVFK